MAKFKFIGDPRDDHKGPKKVTKYGITFTLGGSAVEVKDERVADKLRDCDHFSEMTAANADKEAKRLKKAADAAAKTAEAAKAAEQSGTGA